MSSHMSGSSPNPSWMRLQSNDTVAVAIEALPAGAAVELGQVTLVLREDIPAGHKVALEDVAAGGRVLKYGYVIGVATRPIYTGQHVHTHNLAFVGAAFGTRLRCKRPSQRGSANVTSRHVSGHCATRWTSCERGIMSGY